MKIKEIRFELATAKKNDVPIETVVDGIRFNLVHYVEMSQLRTMFFFSAETAVDVSFVNKLVEAVVLQTLKNIHYQKDIESGTLFSLIEIPNRIVRLGKDRLLTVRYETMMKYDLVRGSCSFIGGQNNYGNHETIQELFLQNAYRLNHGDKLLKYTIATTEQEMRESGHIE